MDEKDQIIAGLLRSKLKLIADRNELFSVIEDELFDLRKQLNSRIDQVLLKMNELNDGDIYHN